MVESDGKKHVRITLYLTPVVGMMALVGSRNISWGLACAAGCLAGVVLSPDLDMEMITDSEWRIIKIPIVGWLLGSLWVGFWLPYALAFRHRGISHIPGLGTLTRVAYLSLLVVPTLIWLGWFAPALELWPLWLWAFIGLVCADCGHALRDYYGLEL